VILVTPPEPEITTPPKEEPEMTTPPPEPEITTPPKQEPEMTTPPPEPESLKKTLIPNPGTVWKFWAKPGQNEKKELFCKNS
jgi:biotin carboxyl carrier protein